MNYELHSLEVVLILLWGIIVLDLVLVVRVGALYLFFSQCLSIVLDVGFRESPVRGVGVRAYTWGLKHTWGYIYISLDIARALN